MKLDPTQIRLLNLASRVPAFGFYQGLVMAFPAYFQARKSALHPQILNVKPQEKVTKYYRFLDKIKPLLKHNYLIKVADRPHLHEPNPVIGVHSIFKVSDKGWRTVYDQLQPRIHYNRNTVTRTAHDLLVTSVLLTFHLERGHSLFRPTLWRHSVDEKYCPLPDGVVESKAGEIFAVEVERHCDKRHLEGHIIYHGRYSRVYLIYEHVTRRTANLTLQLLKKAELENWFFTSCRLFFRGFGEGPYFNFKGDGFYMNEAGELLDKQTWLARRNIPTNDT